MIYSFKHYQQTAQVDPRRGYSQDGYGLPAENRPTLYGQRPYSNIPSLVPNAVVSSRNRQLALTLAKRAMSTQQNVLRPPFRVFFNVVVVVEMHESWMNVQIWISLHSRMTKRWERF